MSLFEKIQLLEKAKEILETKDWCQGGSSKNNKGEFVAYDNPSACSFCLAGALWKAENELDNFYSEIVIDDLRLATKFLSLKELFDWNDSPDTTKEDVLELYNKLLEKYNSEAEIPQE